MTLVDFINAASSRAKGSSFSEKLLTRTNFLAGGALGATEAYCTNTTLLSPAVGCAPADKRRLIGYTGASR